jgi:WD40 repeat protein
MTNIRTGQYLAHVWDPWGKKVVLEVVLAGPGHIECAYCLEYSLDGEYLASGSGDRSIRIWRTESFHSTSSNPDSERGTRTPKQADKILLGSRISVSLSFSRTDSNLLASGGSNGEIKVWNVKEQACVHSFASGGGWIHSLYFAGGADIACIAVTNAGSIIRLWRAEGASDFASETVGETDRAGLSPREVAFSSSGSFLATSFTSRAGDGNESTLLELYELETMTKTQSVLMPEFIATCVAVSPDSKQLVYGSYDGRIQVFQTDDFNIQRDMDTTGEEEAVRSVAFDATSRVVAFSSDDGRLELRRL